MSYRGTRSQRKEHPESLMEEGIPSTSRPGQIRGGKKKGNLFHTWRNKKDTRQETQTKPSQEENMSKYEEAVDLGLNQYEDEFQVGDDESKTTLLESDEIFEEIYELERRVQEQVSIR